MATTNIKQAIKTFFAPMSPLLLAGAIQTVDAQTVNGNDVNFPNHNHNEVTIEPQPNGSVNVVADNQTNNYDSDKILKFKDGISFEVFGSVFVGTDGPAENRDRIYGTQHDDVIEAQDGNDLIYASLGADWNDGGAGWDTSLYTRPECDTPIVLDLRDNNHEGACVEGDVNLNIEAHVLPKNHPHTVKPIEAVSVQFTGGNLVDVATYETPHDDRTSVISGGRLRVTTGAATHTYQAFENIEFAEGVYEADAGKFFIERSLDSSRNMQGTDGDDNFRPEAGMNAIMYSSAGCDHYDGRNDAWSTVSYLNAESSTTLNLSGGFSEMWIEINAENNNAAPDAGLDSSCDTSEGVQAFVGSRNARTYFVSGENNEQFTANHENSFAVYDGNISDYQVEVLPGDTLRVRDMRGNQATDGVDTLKNVDFIAFNDGFYRDGQTRQYQLTVEVDPANLPGNALGVAIYYGPNLDQEFATADAMKDIVEDRLDGSITPAFGQVGSALGEGTQVHVFSNAELNGQKTPFQLPISGTLDNPMGVVMMAILPVANNNEVLPYHQRNLPAAERFQSEVPIHVETFPALSHVGDRLVHNVQEAACYFRGRYPDAFAEIKDNANLSTSHNMMATIFTSESACAKFEDENQAYEDAHPDGP